MGRVGFEPHERDDDDDDDEPLPHSHYKMIICLKILSAANSYDYVNIAVTNINKTLLLNMVIFRNFNFREYEIKNIIAIQFS